MRRNFADRTTRPHGEIAVAEQKQKGKNRMAELLIGGLAWGALKLTSSLVSVLTIIGSTYRSVERR